MAEAIQATVQPEPVAAPASSGGVWSTAWALWHREMVLFLRQKNRVASALLTPALLWIGLGAGLNQSMTVGGGEMGREAASGLAASGGVASGVTSGGGGYMAYFFPGMLSMIVMFTAVFSAISIIEDRREGFMQGVLVAPVPRLSIVLGKVFGGASLGLVQACIFLLIWPLVGGFPGWPAEAAAVGVLAVTALAMTAMGLCIAWPMDSTAGFHAIMMLLLMPMWFLSGAVFPVSTAMPWLRVLMWLNPLTYGQAVLSQALIGHDAVATLLPTWLDVVFMFAFCVGMMLLAVRLVSKPRKDGV